MHNAIILVIGIRGGVAGNYNLISLVFFSDCNFGLPEHQRTEQN